MKSNSLVSIVCCFMRDAVLLKYLTELESQKNVCKLGGTMLWLCYFFKEDCCVIKVSISGCLYRCF